MPYTVARPSPVPLPTSFEPYLGPVLPFVVAVVDVTGGHDAGGQKHEDQDKVQRRPVILRRRVEPTCERRDGRALTAIVQGFLFGHSHRYLPASNAHTSTRCTA